MPEICRFYGIIIYMYYEEGKHDEPHFHAKYGGDNASIAIETGKVLAGALPPGKMKRVQAWLKLHRGELQKNWQLVQKNEKWVRIAPLQ